MVNTFTLIGTLACEAKFQEFPREVATLSVVVEYEAYNVDLDQMSVFTNRFAVSVSLPLATTVRDLTSGTLVCVEGHLTSYGLGVLGIAADRVHVLCQAEPVNAISAV